MQVCGQREDAEDTMQEVLLKALPYLLKFESPRALRVWLYKVAKNRCLMSRRKSKFAPKQDLSLAGDTQPTGQADARGVRAVQGVPGESGSHHHAIERAAFRNAQQSGRRQNSQGRFEAIRDSTDDDRRRGSAGVKKSEGSRQKKAGVKGWQESLGTWPRAKSKHPGGSKTLKILRLRRP
jgi:hypothetical protein